MDTTTGLFLLAMILGLLGWFVLIRLRPKPPGTYGDPRLRSQGNIAHVEREYVDPALRHGDDRSDHTPESDTPLPASVARARSEQRMTAQGMPVDEFIDAETLPRSKDKNTGSNAPSGAGERS